jgi:tetratricopeptide (TPR) repeat protein
MDDYPAIANNPKIKTLSAAKSYFEERKRPITYLSFAINYALHGLEPTGYHLVNVLLHASVAFLAFIFLWATFGITTHTAFTERAAYRIAFWIAVLFLVHPAATQAVSYAYQRSTLLAAFFSFLALLFVPLFCLRRSRMGIPEQVVWLVGILVAILLAAGSKENAAILPFLLYFYVVLIVRPAISRTVLVLVGLLLVILLLAFPFAIKGPHYVSQASQVYNARTFTPIERLLTQSRVVVFYGTLLLWPLPTRLNLDHDFPLSLSLAVPASTFIAVVALLGLVALAISIRRRAPLVSFGILWFLIALVIESSIIPLEMVFEHRLYFPALGLLLACAEGARRSNAWLVSRFTIPGGVPGFLLGAVVFAFCLATINRNQIWQHERGLWADTASKSPAKTRPVVALANTYRESGDHERALKLLRGATDHLSQPARAYYTMGLVFLEQGLENEAERLYRQALGVTPRLAEPFNDLGIIAFRRGDLLRAETLFRKAIDREPAFAKAYANLGIVAMEKRNWEEALEYSRDALRINPEVEGYERIRQRIEVLRQRLRE